MNKPIHVFLRHCYYSPCEEEINRERPDWFDKEKIFRNFKRTINHDLADYTIIYDKHFGSRKETFLFNEQSIEIDCGTEAGSFVETLQVVEEMEFDGDTIIYFLEDDYLHRKGWCEILLEGFTLPVDFVTLYDHPDKYGKGYENLAPKIYFTESCHWRTTPSTTNTYAVKMGRLIDDFRVHMEWSELSSGITSDRGKFEALERGGRMLASSIPGYSTHVNDQQSPTINWKKVMNYE